MPAKVTALRVLPGRRNVDESPALDPDQWGVVELGLGSGDAVRVTSRGLLLLRSDDTTGEVESSRVTSRPLSVLAHTIPADRTDTHGLLIQLENLRRWTYAKNEYLSGEISAHRIDVPALGLTPLRLEDHGVWDPDEEYWCEEGEPLPEWALPIIARGPRRECEMEQVLPGDDPDDPDGDPIIQSNDLKDRGDFAGAQKLLMQLLDTDLRCLDAHAHLGNLVFDHRPEDAINHYEIGMRIGELSLGANFDDVLSWGWIDNRPFLRCMSGYGLCLWRLGKMTDAAALFERMRWLNPSDNQGERFNLQSIREGHEWKDEGRAPWLPGVYRRDTR